MDLTPKARRELIYAVVTIGRSFSRIADAAEEAVAMMRQYVEVHDRLNDENAPPPRGKSAYHH